MKMHQNRAATKILKSLGIRIPTLAVWFKSKKRRNLDMSRFRDVEISAAQLG